MISYTDNNTDKNYLSEYLDEYDKQCDEYDEKASMDQSLYKSQSDLGKYLDELDECENSL